ncbi:O-antigen ligase family protein [Prescottella defluvii]|nr:O-antigen ligase family protein [Prescottella defluvii]
MAVGLAAALVAVRSPVLPGLLNLSAMLVLFGIFWAVKATPPGTLRSLRVTSVDLMFVSFIVGKFVVEYVNAGDFGTSFSLSTLVDVVVAYGALIAVRIVCRSEDDIWAAARGFVAPAALVSIIAVLQIMDFPGLNQVLAAHVNSGGLEARLDKGWDIRATSTIGHWTALGGYLCGISALVGAQMIRNRSRAHPNGRLGVLLILVVFAQVATLTFATIALNLSIALYALYRIKIRISILVVGGIAALAVWVAVGSLIASRVDKQLGGPEYAAKSYSWLPQSVGYRVDVWINESIPAAMERPFTGWGSSTYQRIGTEAASSYLRWISPESEWMRTAVSYGLIVLALQLMLLYCAWRYISRAARNSSGRAMAPFIVFYVGILIISFIHPHLTNRGVPLVLWFIVGISVAMVDRSVAARSSSEDCVSADEQIVGS